jgi:hypothetical protein
MRHRRLNIQRPKETRASRHERVGSVTAAGCSPTGNQLAGGVMGAAVVQMEDALRLSPYRDPHGPEKRRVDKRSASTLRSSTVCRARTKRTASCKLRRCRRPFATYSWMRPTGSLPSRNHRQPLHSAGLHMTPIARSATLVWQSSDPSLPPVNARRHQRRWIRRVIARKPLLLRGHTSPYHQLNVSPTAMVTPTIAPARVFPSSHIFALSASWRLCA